MTFQFFLRKREALKPSTKPKPTLKKYKSKSKLLLADRLYIPTHLLRVAKVKEAFERYVFKQEGCNRCRVYRSGERYSELCKPCDNFLGFYKTWQEVTVGNEDYYAIPSGDTEYIEDKLNIDLKDFEIHDLRSDVKAKNPLTFTAKLFKKGDLRNGEPAPNQKRTVKQFYKTKRGMIRCPPRFGKTVLAAHITCKYKRRLLYVAHEKQLLKQFYKTLLGFTNLRALRKSTGEKIAGIVEVDSDWNEDWDVVLCTYQQFIREKGFDRLKKYVVGKFGVLIIDEAHRSNANAYTSFVSKLNMKYKIGMTATVNLKSGKQFLAQHTIGPVVAESDVVAMSPEVDVIHTKLKPKGGFRGRAAYVYANQWLAKNKERKQMLVKQVFKDLRENPKHCIVIPVMFTGQIRNMVKLINDQAVYNNANKGENWSEELAVAYYDDKKGKQSQILDEVRKGTKTRVIFGIRKMLKEGIDVPAWTHMYLTFPMNNEPDFYQMTQRVSTPYEGKPQPILRIFVDDIPLSERCFMATYHHINKHKYTYSDGSGDVIQYIFDKQKPKDRSDDW